MPSPPPPHSAADANGPHPATGPLTAPRQWTGGLGAYGGGVVDALAVAPGDPDLVPGPQGGELG
ncbi:hypothetical protein Srubr_00090 [Streptomyces rubradiris]|uniref:Uncharacterized protein n=1 Tax=Streptomyces rubradiris TaxID=285531 RepID=A0ABQ3R2S5_STRRR|nr:hypothetical protein GCM10018792_15540 [Streptomyces rubradiris]GHI50163.1 hypothetical protein Srubr_00090 [Streptomyces rubradiris]